jgi:hypothetical protein
MAIAVGLYRVIEIGVYTRANGRHTKSQRWSQEESCHPRLNAGLVEDVVNKSVDVSAVLPVLPDIHVELVEKV